MTHPDDAGRRIGEALRAQASRGPLPAPHPPADRPRPDRSRMGPPPAPRGPGRLPPPAPRPAPAVAAAPAPVEPARGSDRRQIVWALVITLLVGAILGGGLALVSLLLPGVLPTIG